VMRWRLRDRSASGSGLWNRVVLGRNPIGSGL
jgi:hypothetical protein